MNTDGPYVSANITVFLEKNITYVSTWKELVNMNDLTPFFIFQQEYLNYETTIPFPKCKIFLKNFYYSQIREK